MKRIPFLPCFLLALGLTLPLAPAQDFTGGAAPAIAGNIEV